MGGYGIGTNTPTHDCSLIHKHKHNRGGTYIELRVGLLPHIVAADIWGPEVDGVACLKDLLGRDSLPDKGSGIETRPRGHMGPKEKKGLANVRHMHAVSSSAPAAVMLCVRMCNCCCCCPRA